MRSIRWQLVGSYVLIALLATLVVRGLSLSIVSSYFAQQERAQLSESARVAAEDVVAFLWPEPNVPGLRSLAISYGFLGQTRIVVLGSQGELLADSGPHSWAPPHSETPGVVAETEVLSAAPRVSASVMRPSMPPTHPHSQRHCLRNTHRSAFECYLSWDSLALLSPLTSKGHTFPSDPLRRQYTRT